MRPTTSIQSQDNRPTLTWQEFVRPSRFSCYRSRMTKRVESTISLASFGQAFVRCPLRRGVPRSQEGRCLQSRHRRQRYGRHPCMARGGPQGKACRPRHFRNRETGDDTTRACRRRRHMGPWTTGHRLPLHRGCPWRPFCTPGSRVHRSERPRPLGAA